MHPLMAFTAGALIASAYHCRRGFAREWRFACQDVRDLRVDLRRYLEGH